MSSKPFKSSAPTSTKIRQYSFDSKCKELALHFLPDELGSGSEQANELAQAIQDAVEDYFLLVEQRNSHSASGHQE